MAVLLYLAMPLCIFLGIYLLIRCISILWRIIMPAIRHRFKADIKPYVFHLPKAGRYTLSIVFPPLTIISGTAYFSAQFAIKEHESGAAIAYRSTSRSLLGVRRTDMRGYASHALGNFECMKPGDYAITCLTPEKIRPEFQLKISPYVSFLKLVPVILGTILASGMIVGGTIMLILLLAGKIG
ncbi:hypothetical protein [Ochrobactrum sp. Marseille-Q0166]|uniref:hypothetical protein n=1 Tax=Ochrobactrum sp. Marseille-Q0166 TaxID=2761105 RepID=UPI001654D951|nr:hypothetical protein [Ochrobactrum sp. Marseille-Q0166]MBC8716165.1 hypothetical protein [Ochrobactrum sp. Marseille-Q0166]